MQGVDRPSHLRLQAVRLGCGAPALMRAEVERLLALPDDWDTYGSPPIDRTVAERVDRLLDLIELLGMTLPAVIPMSSGGISVEWWSYKDNEITISVEPDEAAEIYWEGEPE